MGFKHVLRAVVTVIMLGATVALAVFDPVNDDTDIFLANPTIAAERPNVLIVVDNSANWNSTARSSVETSKRSARTWNTP